MSSITTTAALPAAAAANRASSFWAQLDRGRRDKKVQVAASARTAASLESALPCASSSCSQCQQPILPDPSSCSTDSRLGKIMWLPEVASLPRDSVALDPAIDLHHGAGNHPCMVAVVSRCSHLVFCMPVTSFGGRGIVAKYSSAADPRGEFYEAYMPLQENNTAATHSRGALEYLGGRLPKQSYIHLEFGYWVEWASLSPRGTATLTAEALKTVKQAYHDAEKARQQGGGSRAKARLARSRSPPSQPGGWRRSRTPPPPTATITHSASRKWAPPSPPPSPPSGVWSRAGNAAKKQPSREKVDAMRGSWR